MQVDVEGLGFTPTNAVEQLMLEALVSPEKLPAFLASLANAGLIFPVFRDGTKQVEPTTLTLLKQEGHEGIAAYTSPSQLSKALPDVGPALKMTGARFTEGWDGTTPVLLNPGGDLGLVIDAGTVEGWREASSA